MTEIMNLKNIKHKNQINGIPKITKLILGEKSTPLIVKYGRGEW